MKDNSPIDSTRAAAILLWLRERKEEMAALLAEFIAIPTENPPGSNYGACTDLLEQRIRQLDLDCKRIAPCGAPNESRDAPATLMATYGSGERTLYFHGHYDMVRLNRWNSSSQSAKKLFCSDAATNTSTSET